MGKPWKPDPRALLDAVFGASSKTRALSMVICSKKACLTGLLPELCEGECVRKPLESNKPSTPIFPPLTTLSLCSPLCDIVGCQPLSFISATVPEVLARRFASQCHKWVTSAAPPWSTLSASELVGASVTCFCREIRPHTTLLLVHRPEEATPGAQQQRKILRWEDGSLVL